MPRRTGSAGAVRSTDPARYGADAARRRWASRLAGGPRRWFDARRRRGHDDKGGASTGLRRRDHPRPSPAAATRCWTSAGLGACVPGPADRSGLWDGHLHPLVHHPGRGTQAHHNRHWSDGRSHRRGQPAPSAPDTTPVVHRRASRRASRRRPPGAAVTWQLAVAGPTLRPLPRPWPPPGGPAPARRARSPGPPSAGTGEARWGSATPLEKERRQEEPESISGRSCSQVRGIGMRTTAVLRPEPGPSRVGPGRHTA